MEFKSLEFTPIENTLSICLETSHHRAGALRDSIYSIGSLMIGNERRDHGAERKVWNI